VPDLDQIKQGELASARSARTFRLRDRDRQTLGAGLVRQSRRANWPPNIGPFIQQPNVNRRLDPVDKAMPETGVARYRWRGYRFDLRTGESVDGQGYRLAATPGVAVGPLIGEASLVRCSRPRSGRNTVNKPSSGRKAQTR
jgi:hypothetical protein